MSFSFSSKGDFSKTTKFFARASEPIKRDVLDRYGRLGVEALRNSTPKDTGLTASSWSYEIVQTKGSSSVYWRNSNEKDGVNIAVILQYGHGTKNGGYVKGIDYINPAIRPIFQSLADEAWKEVTKD